MVFVLLGVLTLGSGIFQWKVLRVHLSDPERVRCVKEVTYVTVSQVTKEVGKWVDVRR